MAGIFFGAADVMEQRGGLQERARFGIAKNVVQRVGAEAVEKFQRESRHFSRVIEIRIADRTPTLRAWRRTASSRRGPRAVRQTRHSRQRLLPEIFAR